MSLKIAIIPDVQCKPGVPNEHLTWAGKYLAEKKPDVIVNLCDFYDMPSLCSYDKGKKSFEGRRVSKDLDAGHRGLELLHTPIAKVRGYNPELEATLGNHEHRISILLALEPQLIGTIGLDKLRFKDYGYRVHPFLRPVKVAGFHFAHYFPSGIMGRPCTTARKMLTLFHVSCIAGHQQGLDQATSYKPDGKRIMCMIAGSFYQHKENYLTPISNKHWRGIIMLHEARAGEADPMFVSLNFLKRRYK